MDAPEAALLAHLPDVDRCIAALCTRYGIMGADADDIAGWIRLRLVENDYAIIRKFTGRSSLRTYLAVVIANLFRDHHVGQRGRWRASAAAQRLGSVAERLERLVYGQRLTLRQAIAVIRSRGDTTLSDRALLELFRSIPVRLPIRPTVVDDDAMLNLPADQAADDAVRNDEERSARDGLRAALLRALQELPPEDRLILRLRFWEAMSVADVGRALALPAKPLYRRIERNLGLLRDALAAQGVQADDALAFTSGLTAADSGAIDSSMMEA